jgi:hypothetical protein
LSRLVNLPALEELNLDSCPVGDWAIAHLADNNVVPNLTSLDLADTDLTDLGMAHLVRRDQDHHYLRLALLFLVTPGFCLSFLTPFVSWY